MNTILARELFDKAFILVGRNSGTFTSNDKKLYIFYDAWEDYLVISLCRYDVEAKMTKKIKDVFIYKMGDIIKFEEEDTEWQNILKTELKKRGN